MENFHFLDTVCIQKVKVFLYYRRDCTCSSSFASGKIKVSLYPFKPFANDDRKEINYCNFVWDFVDWYREFFFIDPYISGKMASITFVRDPIPISPFPIPQTTLWAFTKDDCSLCHKWLFHLSQRTLLSFTQDISLFHWKFFFLSQKTLLSFTKDSSFLHKGLFSL